MAAKSSAEWPAASLALIPLGVVAAYFDVATYGLVWDDTALFGHLTRNGELAGWDELSRQALPFSENYFRPLALWTFHFIHAHTEGSVGAQHWANVLIHASNALAVGWLVRTAFSSVSTRRAVGIGCLYGLHPALVEPTAWISGRFDLLLTSGLLAMLIADARCRDRLALRLALVSAAFAAALGCKETAVVFPVVLLAWWRVTTPTDPLGRARQHQGVVAAGLAAVFSVWLIVRVTALGGLIFAEPSVVTGGIGSRLLAASGALQAYARVAIAPFGAVSPIHVGPNGEAIWLQCLGAIVVLALLGSLGRAARDHRWACLVLGSLALLVPVLHLQPLNLAGGALIAERYLAAPLAMAALALAWVPAAPPRRARVVVLIALFTCFATVRSVAPRWSSAVELWTWAEHRAPSSILPPINLAKTHYEDANYADALAAAERALAIEPDHPFAANNGCASLIELERPTEAASWCQIGLDSGMASPSQWVNLMRAQLAADDSEGAIATHTRARERWNLRTERMEALLAEAIVRQQSQDSPSDHD